MPNGIAQYKASHLHSPPPPLFGPVYYPPRSPPSLHAHHLHFLISYPGLESSIPPTNRHEYFSTVVGECFAFQAPAPKIYAAAVCVWLCGAWIWKLDHQILSTVKNRKHFIRFMTANNVWAGMQQQHTIQKNWQTRLARTLVWMDWIDLIKWYA